MNTSYFWILGWWICVLGALVRSSYIWHTIPEISSRDTRVEYSITNKLQSLAQNQQLVFAQASANNIPLYDASTLKMDYESDNSLTKFVSAKKPLTDKTYIPQDLEIIENPYIVTTQSAMKLRHQAAQALESLAKEFYTVFWKKIVIVSAYRSYTYQAGLANWCSPSLCARPGYSEHQLGLTIDIFAATTSGDFLSKADFNKYYQWLIKNAHRFGRHNTYQKWVTIDTYQVEPRHWRYVGRDLATKLHNEWLTFAQWYEHYSHETSQENEL